MSWEADENNRLVKMIENDLHASVERNYERECPHKDMRNGICFDCGEEVADENYDDHVGTFSDND